MPTSTAVECARRHRRSARRDRSLFERILSGLPDDETFIVHRGRHAASSSSTRTRTRRATCMVLPNRAVADLEDLDADELAELAVLTPTPWRR